MNHRSGVRGRPVVRPVRLVHLGFSWPAAWTLLFMWVLAAGANAQGEIYMLTRRYYSETSNLDARVKQEFGTGAAVAEWNTIKLKYMGRVAAFCDRVGLTNYRDNAMCVRNGKRFWSGNRHYFLERHNGRVPGNWLVHDQIDRNTVSLGSWFGLRMRILARLTTHVRGSGTTRPGGRVDFGLTAGGDAGLPYQVGTSFGTGPILLGPRWINLSADSLLTLSVSGLLPAVFSSYAGRLDNKGQALARLRLPGISALIGRQLHTAFVTLDVNAPRGVRSISNTFSFVVTR